MVLVACKHEKVKTECYMFDESAVSERKLSDESRENRMAEVSVSLKV